MSAPARALRRAQTAIAGWLLLGTAAFLLLPWYLPADKSVLQALPGVFGGADTASGAVQAAVHGKPWLWVGLLGFVIAAAAWRLPAGRAQGRWLTCGGGLGLAGLLLSGFAIGAKGWSFEWMNASLGALVAGQFGMGLGAALTLVALLILLGAGLARLGYFRGDVFVASAVVFCGMLLALFVALPVLRALASAFFNEAGDFAVAAVWERIGNERTWGLSCVVGGQRCGVAWNTLFLALITAAGTTVLGTMIALLAERGSQRLKKPLNMLALLPIITPPFVVGLGLILLFGRAGIVNQILEAASASRRHAGSTALSACGWHNCSRSRRSPS